MFSVQLYNRAGASGNYKYIPLAIGITLHGAVELPRWEDALAAWERFLAEHPHLRYLPRWGFAAFAEDERGTAGHPGEAPRLEEIPGTDRARLLSDVHRLLRGANWLYPANRAPYLPGEHLQVWVQPSLCPARVLAAHANERVVEYSLPGGDTFLRRFDIRRPQAYRGRMSYRSISTAWLQRIYDAEQEWDGRARSGTFQPPPVREYLFQRVNPHLVAGGHSTLTVRENA